MESIGGWLALLALVFGVALVGRRVLARRQRSTLDNGVATVAASKTQSVAACEVDAQAAVHEAERHQRARVEAEALARLEAQRAEAHARAQAHRAEADARAQAHRAEAHARAQAHRAEAHARARAQQAETQRAAAQQAEEQAALLAAYAQAAADAERREARALAAEQARDEAERLAREHAERVAAEAVARQARDAAAAEARAEAKRLARAEAAERALAQAAAAAAAKAAAERSRTEAAEREAAAARLAVAAVPRTPAQTLVMVADDSKVVRVKTGRVLAKHGYRFALAEDGQQALSLLEAELPHVVVTDVEMPGVDGFELTRRLRTDPRTARVPIVMITAADDRLRSAAAEAGVTVVLGKPYDDDTLVAHIETLAGVRTSSALPV
jgi:CheY-like chemotaxis protein